MPGTDGRVEDIDPRRFRPPFCPNPRCSAHVNAAARSPFYFFHGHYRRRCDGRLVPRFRCRTCRRTFSQQTFAASYYLKRPELLAAIANCSVQGPAIRQIARILLRTEPTCSKTTVAGQLLRAGRHCLLLQARLLERIACERLAEPRIVYDDFEGFAWSQYFPYGAATAVGSASRFFYYLDLAQHRRGGRLSPRQRVRQRFLDRLHGRVSRGQHARSFSRFLRLTGILAAAGQRQIVVVTDNHPAYASAWGRSRQRSRLSREIHPNPKRGPRGSRRTLAARVRDRAMRPVDELHSLLRHSRAHNRRETIAFGRRHSDQLLREYVLMVWRNMVKRKTERRSEDKTPAMSLGLARHRWDWGRVFSARLFPSKLTLPEGWMDLYVRGIDTLPLKVNRRHDLKLAF